jgi:lipopolysaccharide export system permease protein
LKKLTDIPGFQKIDLYIIKKYLVSFFFTMMLITMVAVTMNFFENVDKFLIPDISWKNIVFTYYLNWIPWINGLLWPLFALLSVIFFTSRLARDSEIISVLSSGMSYNRLLLPFLVAATFVSILLWIGNNYVIPNSSRIKNEFEGEYLRKSEKKTLSTDIHFYTSPNEKAYFRVYSSRDSTARNFRLEKFKNGKIIAVLKADNIKYKDKIKKWEMVDIEEHYFNGLSESLVIKKNQRLDTTLTFEPADFIRYNKQMEMLTSGELRDFIKAERKRGLDAAQKYRVELYRRTADPFTIIILTVIGVCVASRKVRGGLGWHLAIGVILGSIYVIVSKFSITFANNLSLHPGIAVWIPNVVFTFVSYYLYLKAQK